MDQEKELDFSFIFTTIGKWFILILLFTILGFGIAVFYNYGAPILYESETSLYVEPPINANQINYDGILSNQKMVKTYTQIIKSRKILNEVIKKIGKNHKITELQEMLTVKSVSETEIITITVTSQDKNEAKDIANLIAEVFIDEIKETMEITNIRVIDEAIVNHEPVSPNTTLNYIIGIAVGTCVGLLLAFIIEAMNNKIVTHEDVKKYLGLKTLGLIPHNSIEVENKNSKKKKKTYEKNRGLIGEEIKIITDPTSVISESVRMIRTNLNFLDLKVINIVSTAPSEGKTSLICDLAASFSMLEKKVLIIDCDLRKPKIHKKFGLARKDGVTDVILSHGEISLSDAIQKYEDKETNVRVDVLAAGSRVANPSELINKKSFETMLEELRKHYDLIFIDCCPISSMTDGVLVSKLADGTVYVIESERTDYPVIQTCIEELKGNNVTLLGAVLTKVNIKRQKKLYGYKYDYYYSNYNK